MTDSSLPAVFPKKVITDNLEATDPEGVIRELVDLMVSAGTIDAASVDDLVATLLVREREGSTGIGGGVGIPHIKTDLHDTVVGAIGRSEHGVDFNAVDGEPVYLFFLFFVPKDQPDVHLELLRKISSMVRNKLYCQFMRNAKRKGDIHDVLKEFEEQVG